MTGQNLPLPPAWWSIDLPGVREGPEPSTYTQFSYLELPPIKDPGSQYSWLTAVPVRADSIAEEGGPAIAKFNDLLPHIAALLPPAFRVFMRDAKLPGRVRSCTDCFLEAPDYFIHTAPPLDGWLVHFLSDSQWVLHWYLHLKPDGSHFVVVSTEAFGFLEEGTPDPDQRPATDFLQEVGRPLHEEPRQDWSDYTVALADHPAWYCAPTFSEFIYRFWIENEIWFNLTEKKPLPKAQLAYVEYYKH